jgi:IS30 family transposase
VYNREEGVAGLYDQSREPRTIKYKVTQETEETIIIDLRLKRFGCNRIRFRLKRLGVSLSSRTIYKMLRSRHGLNILKSVRLRTESTSDLQ